MYFKKMALGNKSLTLVKIQQKDSNPKPFKKDEKNHFLVIKRTLQF